jgi:hypothetical protein
MNGWALGNSFESYPLLSSLVRCSRLRQLLPFAEQPLSEEERQFPLAYGLLVHKSPLQVMTLLSAIYQASQENIIEFL